MSHSFVTLPCVKKNLRSYVPYIRQVVGSLCSKSSSTILFVLPLHSFPFVVVKRVFFSMYLEL